MRTPFFALVVLLLVMSSTQPSMAQTGYPENGEDVFKACCPCHQLGPGANNGIEPSLDGNVGSKAGTVDGFIYFDANKQAGVNGIIWSGDTLYRFLENSTGFMPSQIPFVHIVLRSRRHHKRRPGPAVS